MSRSGNGDTKITNETTIWRRAWVAEALEGVRSRLTPDTADTESVKSGGDVAVKSAAVTRKPRLYVAWSASQATVDEDSA